MIINSKTKFWLLLLICLILTISDLILTYIGTPDLSNEANPLVSVFGLGWGALISANVIFFIVYVWLAYYSFIKYKRPIIECEGIKQYVSMLFFDRPDKFIWIFWKFPPNKTAWMRAFAPIAYSILFSFIFFRTVLVVEWIGIINESYVIYWYFKNMRVISALSHIIVLIFSFLIFFIYWFCKEYKINYRELKLKDIKEK